MDRLTVGVDGRCLAGRPTGVGRYLRNLLREMTDLEPGVRFRLYLPRNGDHGLDGTKVESVVLGLPSGPLDNVMTWSHLRLPAHLLRSPVDLLHCPFYTLPVLCPTPAIVTIHDITFDLHPEWFTRRARLAFRGFAAASARKAGHVLTVSECSRRDIIARYGVPAERVTAAPLAPDPEFRPIRDPVELARILGRYRLEDPYVLHVGSITPRRNIGRLLDAFAAARREHRNLTLMLAGKVEPPSGPVEIDIRRRGLEGAVRVGGYVDPGDLPGLYSAARALVYPSLYEGFGLPVLEAMACGLPVLASNTSCFPEVVGDAGILVDPSDTRSIAEGLSALLSDTARAGELRGRGLARAAKFTWTLAAKETLSAYRKVLASAGKAAARSGTAG